jgi:dihydrofolate reductase
MMQSLLAADLVGELVLTVVPLVIGSGKKLFPMGLSHCCSSLSLS